MTFLYFRTLTDSDTPSKIFGLLFVGFFLFTTYFIITRLRIVKISADKIKIRYPLLFKRRQIEIAEITKLNWSTKGTIKFGDFKELQIETNNKPWDKITDFEFGNFEKLESELISKLLFEPNLVQKREIEIAQARSNRIVAIVFLTLCIILIVVGVMVINSKGIHLLSVVITGLCFISALRLISQSVKYKETLREYDKARARRKKS